MSKASNCIVTIASENSQNDNAVHTRLKKVFISDPILHDISIVLEDNSISLYIDNLIKNIYKFEVDEFTKLPELLQEVTSHEFNGKVIIEAIPMHHIAECADLDTIDILQFNSATRQITLRLTNNTFHSSPNLFNNEAGMTVKKINESKKGHGASNHISYNYLISFSLLEQSISLEMSYLVRSIFSRSKVKVVTCEANNISFFQGGNESPGITTRTKLNIRQYPIFTDTDIHEHSNSIYEYLSLLHMNSPQLTENMDNYISSYSAPDFNYTGVEKKLYRYKFDNMDSHILDLLLRRRWLTISAYSERSHIILLKDPDNHNLMLWECQ